MYLHSKNKESVATVLTVYGIETICPEWYRSDKYYTLQQYLPFTVLKRLTGKSPNSFNPVATVLTVYGIETYIKFLHPFFRLVEVATVLTVYGIETFKISF